MVSGASAVSSGFFGAMNVLPLLRARRDHLSNARATRAELQRRQLAKFRRLAAFLVQRSPHYRDIIAERRIDVRTCVPGDFPVLTKTDLMANFDRIVTDPGITKRGVQEFFTASQNPFDLYHGRYIALHTSGSSGETGFFVYSQDDWMRGLAQALRAAPPSLARRRVGFFGATQGHYAGVSMTLTSRRWPLSLLYDVATFEINRPVAEAVDGLQRFQPNILIGYPSCLAILAEKQRRGGLRLSPQHIQTSGEPVQAADRKAIEEAFGVPLTNVYSCTEHMLMGLSRADLGGMYLMEDDLIFDLATDHMLVTNLFNRTLPMIRYRMNDRLTPIADTVNAFPFTKVAEVVGRSEQVPLFVNRRGEEDFVSPAMIVEYQVPNVRTHQLQRLSATECVMRICFAPSLTDAECRAAVHEAHSRLGAILAQKDMQNVTFRIEVREDLRPDPRTGKFKLIVGPDSP